MATKAETQQKIHTGVEARESGDYETGESLLRAAFQEALILSDQELVSETASQLSIQHRLSAGRFARQNKPSLAKKYSNDSLNIYNQLQEKGFYNKHDAGTVRNHAHALLYAGGIEESIPALRASSKIQDNLGAKGDELCHLAAALIVQGKLEEATQHLEKGIKLIKENEGSPIWLTFAYMTKASLYAKQNNEEAYNFIDQALQLTQLKNLKVREEEILFLQNQPLKELNVLKAVAFLPGKFQ